MKTIVLVYLLLGSAVATAEEAPQIDLKHRSSFNEDAQTRNPFWPIGWKPTAKPANPNPEHAGPNIPSSAFVVSSITLDPGAHFAIINGKAIAEGQQFGLQVGSQVYQLAVKRIEDGRVILLQRDQEIIVPLRRK